MAWKNICKPKKFGGLNIKNCEIWNVAGVCKQIWNVAVKKDTLWVNWIHVNYLKGQNIWDYSVKADDIWYWRKLNKIKGKLGQTVEPDGNWKLTRPMCSL